MKASKTGSTEIDEHRRRANALIRERVGVTDRRDRRPRKTRRKVLLIGGSLNQTMMMHQIAQHLEQCDCFFSPFYADGLVRRLAEGGVLDFTILGGQAKRRTEAYLSQHSLPIDYRGTARDYDLVVTGTDLIVPRNVSGKRLILVQEGMMEPENGAYRLVRALRLPRFLANTSMTGLSHAYTAFCVASEGFRDLFVRKGVDPGKLIVTGIPNFDNCAAFLDNDFPHHGYVLAATSCFREVLRYEDRPGFIRKALRVAHGRQLIFKLHPNERVERATREIEALAPEATIFADGNTNHMISNCDALVTRYSSVMFVAAALQKQVYADLDGATLERLTPVQNGGRSAQHIAEVCLHYLNDTAR